GGFDSRTRGRGAWQKLEREPRGPWGSSPTATIAWNPSAPERRRLICPPTMTPSPNGRPLDDAAHDELAAWDYPLPDELVARRPAPGRRRPRRLRLPRGGGPPLDHAFADLPGLLRPGDLLVGNDTRVMPARLRARRATGGAVEVLLLDPGPGPVRALVRPL